MARKTIRNPLALVATAVLCAACGGGGGDPAPAPADDPLAGPPPGAMADRAGFMAWVKALVARPDESREPASLDGFTPPVDDAGEPDPAA